MKAPSVVNGVPVAKVQDYGYRDNTALIKTLKVLSKIAVVLIVILLYISIAVIALQSFNSSSLVSSFQKFTFKWYGEIFKHKALGLAIRNTFVVSILATLLSTIFGTMIAIGIHFLQKKKAQRILLLNNIPLLNADIVTGITLMLIFSLVMKIPGFHYIFGWKTMLVAHMFFTLPYVILSVLPKLRTMDKNLLDAALDLGMKPFQALIKVVVPAIKSGILSGMLLAFTMSFDDFVISYYTTGNGFNNLSIWIYGVIGRKELTPAVYAFSTLVTVVAMVLLLAVNFITAKRGNPKHAKKK